MKKLIINADDFGYSRGVNYGIIDAYQYGVLTSTTFMSNMPGADHAASLARQNPELGVGVHLVLTYGRPLLGNHRTIVDAEGDFRKLNFYKGAFTIDYGEVYAEWKAQIEKFLSYGLQPTHLDSHHHINSFGEMPQVFMKLAKEYGLPVRNNLDQQEVQTTDYFSYLIETALKDDHSLDELFTEHNSVEVMTHPAYLDKQLLSTSSFTYPRVDELEFLTDSRIARLIEARSDIQLTTFKAL
ncbi:chitin disaccharide deacetylase [Halobacillus shinanisalinarum]|uniref:Carbohydrate deacetylase n=1 Tax=Halobacillus shinanisalinarum TaxID=2932258 RepID=A0ABY4H5F1_9BACI|nr:chitin disaccharide deacetylase [Halobacillus shinanisalinarum]UOQ95325.1 chitin disaccharide deacetylase [Halobacillus shinanisalinarum]